MSDALVLSGILGLSDCLESQGCDLIPLSSLSFFCLVLLLFQSILLTVPEKVATFSLRVFFFIGLGFIWWGVVPLTGV